MNRLISSTHSCSEELVLTLFLIVVVHHGASHLPKAPPVGTRTRTGRDSSSSQQNDAAGIRRRRRVAELTGAGVRVRVVVVLVRVVLVLVLVEDYPPNIGP